MSELENHTTFINRALELAEYGSQNGHGGPFGAVVVKNNVIVGEGFNQVTTQNDPSAHAEIVAIRAACKTLNNFQLEGCIIYTSCEPCPMCLGAIYWARPQKVYYASTKKDAAAAGFDDAFIYDEINIDPTSRTIPMLFTPAEKAIQIFKNWIENPDKTVY